MTKPPITKRPVGLDDFDEKSGEFVREWKRRNCHARAPDATGSQGDEVEGVSRRKGARLVSSYRARSRRASSSRAQNICCGHEERKVTGTVREACSIPPVFLA